MTQTLQCPGCFSRLALPAFPEGQAVVCPRCAQRFETLHAGTNEMASAVPIMAVEVVEAEPPSDEVDDDAEDFASPIRQPGTLRGQIMAMATILGLVVGVLVCAWQLHLAFETVRAARRGIELGLRDPFREMPMGRRGRFVPPPPAIDEFHKQWDQIQELTTAAIPIQLAVFSITLLCFLIWLHLVSANCSWTLQAERLTFATAHLTLCFCTPIINVVCIYAIVQELWRASHPRAVMKATEWKRTARSRLVCVWWLLFLASFVCWFLAIRVDSVRENAGPELAAVVKSTIYLALGQLSFLIAGVALIAVIRGITRRQRERYERLYEEAA